jgi:hypothetical protein
LLPPATRAMWKRDVEKESTAVAQFEVDTILLETIPAHTPAAKPMATVEKSLENAVKSCG